jgi:hypothetical protein
MVARDGLKEGVSYVFTDAQRSFLANIEYPYREARRKFRRERWEEVGCHGRWIKKRNSAY